MTWHAIHDSVNQSESLATLSDWAERLFWRMLAHADLWGRLPGSAAKVRATCCAMLDKSTAEVQAGLDELVRVGRVQLYAIDGDVFAWLIDHDKHQSESIRRRGKSKYPDPPALGETVGDALGDAFRQGAELLDLFDAPAPEKPPAPGRARDELWDTMVELVGHEPRTKRERGAWNGAVKELRDADATPDELRAAAAGFRRAWPKMTLTPPALARHFGMFAAHDARDGDATKAATSWFDSVGRSLPSRAFEEELAKWQKLGLPDAHAERMRAQYSEVADAA